MDDLHPVIADELLPQSGPSPVEQRNEGEQALMGERPVEEAVTWDAQAEADEVIADPSIPAENKLVRLTELRTKQLAPKAADRQAAINNSFAQQDGNDALMMTARQIGQETQQAHSDLANWANDELASKRPTAAALTASFGISALAPGFSYRFSSALADVYPDIPGLYGDVGTALRTAGLRLANETPEVRKQKLQALSKAVKDNADLVGGDYEAIVFTQMITNSIDMTQGDEDFETGMSWLNYVADATIVGGPLLKAGRAVARGIRPGSPAAAAVRTPSGAASAAKAGVHENDEAARLLGTTVEDFVDATMTPVNPALEEVGAIDRGRIIPWASIIHTPAEREAVKAKHNLFPTLKQNTAESADIESGFAYKHDYVRPDGTGYETAAAAQAAIDAAGHVPDKYRKFSVEPIVDGAPKEIITDIAGKPGELRVVPVVKQQTKQEATAAIAAQRAEARAELESASTIRDANRGPKGNKEARAEAEQRIAAARKRLGELNNKAREPKGRVFAAGNAEQGRVFVGTAPTEGRSVRTAENPVRGYKIVARGIRNLGPQDTLADESRHVGKWWEGLFGINANFSQSYIQAAGRGARDTAKANVHFRNVLKPYHALGGGDRRAVQLAYEANEGKKWLTTDQEFALAGLNTGKLRAGYESLRKLSDEAYALNNLRMHNSLVAEGYASYRVGGKDVIARKAAPESRWVLNMATGSKIRVADAGEGEFVRFSHYHEFGPEQFTEGFVPRGTKAYAVPDAPLNYIPGRIHRQYTDPYFIEEEVTTVRNGEPFKYWKAVHTASDEKTAASYRDMLNGGKNAAGKYRARLARERVKTDQWQDLADQGLLRNSPRQDTALTNIDGSPKLGSIEDAIRDTAFNAATQAGLGRWAEVEVARWRATYRDLRLNFDPTSKMKVPAGVGERERWEHAAAWHNHIREVMGMGSHTVPQWVQFRLDAAADFFYARPWLPGSKRIGDTIAQGGEPAIVVAKKQAFALMLAANPLKQLPMQMSSIPMYMGVKGATKYVASGRATNEIMGLIAHDLGFAWDASPRLTAMKRMWDKSGLKALVQEHTFESPMIADRIAVQGSLTRSYDTLINAMKRVGFDVGTAHDKRSAFSVAFNEFTENSGGVLPATQREADVIASRAEEIALNMNRSDPVPFQRGFLGLFTQFMSYQFKMAGRLLGREKNFDRAAWAKMSAYNMAVYGLGGYGAYYTGRAILDDAGVDPDSQLGQLFTDGWAGTVFNAVFNADTNFSSRFGVATFAGVDNVSKFMEGSFMNAGLSINWSEAPALGLIGKVMDLGKFAYTVGGGIPGGLPAWEGAGKSITLETAKTLSPTFNNAIKGLWAMNTGFIHDANGLPIVQAEGRSPWAQALFGLTTRDAEEQSRLAETMFGEWQAMSDDSQKDEVRRWGQELGKIVSKHQQLVHDGQASVADVTEQLKNLNVAVMHGFGPLYAGIALDAAARETQKLFSTKNSRIIDTYMNQLMSGVAVADQDLYDRIKTSPDAPGKDRLLETISMLNEQVETE